MANANEQNQCFEANALFVASYNFNVELQNNLKQIQDLVIKAVPRNSKYLENSKYTLLLTDLLKHFENARFSLANAIDQLTIYLGDVGSTLNPFSGPDVSLVKAEIRDFKINTELLLKSKVENSFVTRLKLLEIVDPKVVNTEQINWDMKVVPHKDIKNFQRFFLKNDLKFHIVFEDFVKRTQYLVKLYYNNNTEENFLRLMCEMKFNKDYKIHPDPAPGEVVLVEDAEMHHRAFIVSTVLDRTKLNVCFLDCVCTEQIIVDKIKIKIIPPDYLQVPFQQVLCKLYNCEEKELTNGNFYKFFKKNCIGKTFTAKIKRLDTILGVEIQNLSGVDLVELFKHMELVEKKTC